MNAWRPALSALFLGAALARAGDDFPLRYGPYTGGHHYSKNVAYSYGFAFSSADTWRRDLFAYPAGIHPYRPYDRPIYYRVYPRPAVPPISVPGPDGLPILSNVAGA
ncbi:MAG: hypothetical protein K2W96_19360, partial [Gemmataceae bacterium]|nr:hypothetical protein [Gemmataceae bacterium]